MAKEASIDQRQKPLGRWVTVSMIVAIVATPVIAWWRIGDLSDSTSMPAALHYKFRFPDVPSPLAVAIVALALGALVISLGVLATATARRDMSPRWWIPLLVAMTTGTALAWCGRATTSGSLDANIGAGVGIVLAVILVLPMISLTMALTTWASGAGRVGADAATPKDPKDKQTI